MEPRSPQGDKKATNTGVMDRSCLISICLALCLGLPSLPGLAADAREQFVCSAPTQRSDIRSLTRTCAYLKMLTYRKWCPI